MADPDAPQPLSFFQFLERTAAWRAGGVSLAGVFAVWLTVKAWWSGRTEVERLAFVDGSVSDPQMAALLIVFAAVFVGLAAHWITHGLYRQHVATYEAAVRRYREDLLAAKAAFEVRPEVVLARELCGTPYTLLPLDGSGVRDLGMFLDVLAVGLTWSQPTRYGTLSSLESLYYGADVRRVHAADLDSAPYEATRALEIRHLVAVDGRADGHDTDDDRRGIDAAISLTPLGSEVLAHVRTFLAARQ